MDFLMKLPSVFDILTVLFLILGGVFSILGKKQTKWWHLVFVVISIPLAYLVFELVNKDNSLVNTILALGPVSGIVDTITKYASIEFVKSLFSAVLFYVFGILFLILIPLIGDIIVAICYRKAPKKTALKTFGIPGIISTFIAWMFIVLPIVVLKPVINSASKVIEAQFSDVEENHVEGNLESKISGIFNGENKIGDYGLKQFDSWTLDLSEKMVLNSFEKVTSKVKDREYFVFSYVEDDKVQDLYGSLVSMIGNPEMVKMIKGLLSAPSLSELPSDFIPTFVNGLCCTILTVDEKQIDPLLNTLDNVLPLIGSVAGDSSKEMLEQVLGDFTYELDGNTENGLETVDLIKFVRSHLSLDENDRYNIEKASFVFKGDTDQEKAADEVYFIKVLLSCLFDNQAGSHKVNFCLAMAQQTLFYKIDVTEDGEKVYCPIYDFAYKITDTSTSSTDVDAELAEGKLLYNDQFYYLGIIYFSAVFPL